MDFFYPSYSFPNRIYSVIINRVSRKYNFLIRCFFDNKQGEVEFSKKNKKRVGYGYLWWLLEPDPNGNGEQYIYAAIGIKAQYIFVIPEHDMVVVVNGDTIPRGVDQQKPVEFLYSNILPAVKR